MEKCSKEILRGNSGIMTGIVLLNYNNFEETIKCTEQILNQITDSDKIYIVDNCSQNDSYNIILGKFKNNKLVRVIKSSINGGYSYGFNIGFRKAVEEGCTEILCTNSDIVFHDNCIKYLKEALDSHPEVAVVGPKIFTKTGNLQKCNKTDLTTLRFLMHHKPFIWLDIFGINKRYVLLDYDFDKELIFTGMVSGCCFLIKSDVLVQTNYFDENVFLYHEEDILAAKLKQCGWKTMIEPKAEIIHFGAGSTGKNSAFTRYCTFTSGLYYLWAYKKISKLTLKILAFWIKINFKLLSLKDKEYKIESDKLKIFLKNLKNKERYNKYV